MFSSNKFTSQPCLRSVCFSCINVKLFKIFLYGIIDNSFIYCGIRVSNRRLLTKLHGLKIDIKYCGKLWFEPTVNNSISNPIILSGCNSIVNEQTKWNMTTPLISSIIQTKCLVNSQSMQQYNNKKLSRMTITNGKNCYLLHQLSNKIQINIDRNTEE